MEYFDVFISFAARDLLRVRAISSALEQAGLRTWGYENDVEDFQSITDAVTTGLARSKALLAYCSLTYPTRRACQWELTAAYIAAQQRGEPTDRVLVLNPEDGVEHIHPIDLRDALFRRPPSTDDESGLRELAAAVAYRVNNLQDSLGALGPVAPSRWLPEPRHGSTRFVGRVSDSWRIHSALTAAESPVTTGSMTNAAQIRGLGGIGKSLLAEEYALRFGAAYPGGVFWMSAHGYDDIGSALQREELRDDYQRQLRLLAETLGLEVGGLSNERVRAALSNELGREGHRFLWIVDDIPSGLEVATVRMYFSPHELGSSLLTTRSGEYDALTQALDLDVLPPPDGLELLTKHRSPAGYEEEDAAERLVEDLGGHALAIEVSGAALRLRQGIQSFEGFRAEITYSDADELELAAELAGVLPNGHERSIATTLWRSVERLDDESRDLLRIAALSVPAMIPARLIASVFAVVDEIGGPAGAYRATRALKAVEDLSLASQDGARWAIHPLVSRTVTFRESQPDRCRQLETGLVTILLKAFSRSGDVTTHEAIRDLADVAREVARQQTSSLGVDLLGLLGQYDLTRGDYSSAVNQHSRQLARAIEVLGEDHPEANTARNNLGAVLAEAGDAARALRVQQEALSVANHASGTHHRNTLIAKLNVGSTLLKLGRLDEARGVQEEVMEAATEAFGAEDALTVTAEVNLAGTLQAQGDLERARELHSEVFEARMKALGENNLDTVLAANNLAGVFAAQGRFEDARALQKQVLERRQEVLGVEHPDTFAAMGNLASTEGKLGDFAEARRLEEEVVAGCRAALGDEHPRTILAEGNLAETLYDQGEVEGARALQERVLESTKRGLGDRHPRTLAALTNLAGTVRAQGDVYTAEQLGRTALVTAREVLGARHEQVAAALMITGSAVRGRMDLVGARALFEEAAEITGEILPETHPAVLAAMNNLAEIMQEQGEVAASQQMHAEVLERTRRAFGPEHPQNVLALCNLANALGASQRDAEARELLEQAVPLAKRTYGPTHGRTLFALEMLAGVLQVQGEEEASEELLLEVTRARTPGRSGQ